MAEIDTSTWKSWKHGMSRTRTWHCWYEMQRRCNYYKHKAYSRYGGRGITVCARWQESFENFLADMGEMLPGMTLDRIDNDGNYEPSNCRWVTRAEQNRNKSNNYRYFVGEMMFTRQEDVAKHLGVSQATVGALIVKNVVRRERLYK